MNTPEPHAAPLWVQLHELIEHGDPAAIETFLAALDPAETVRTIARLEDVDREQILEMLDPHEAADVLEQMPAPQAVDALEHIAPATAAHILEELPSNEQADLINQIEDAEAEAILASMSADEARDVRELLAYDTDVAGGLMITEYLSFTEEATIAQVIDDLGRRAEEYADYDVQYAYVTDDAGRLRGVLRMRDLLLAPRSRRVAQLMITDPLSVLDQTPLADLVPFFREHRFFGVPVVTGDGVLVGIVRRAAVEGAVADESEQAYRQSLGIVGGEELRTMPLGRRARRRLAWLSINIVLNIVAASVIAMHQSTLEAVIALAVFLPIISDMSGCSGNQAVAVSMRELTLGVTRPGEVLRVLGSELSVGLVNGLVLGALIGCVAWIWKANVYLGLVVGSALALNTMVAVAIGGSVPLVLKGLRLDPALASGPILTTITDMCGFFLVLTLAASMLERLA